MFLTFTYTISYTNKYHKKKKGSKNTQYFHNYLWKRELKITSQFDIFVKGIFFFLKTRAPCFRTIATSKALNAKSICS